MIKIETGKATGETRLDEVEDGALFLYDGCWYMVLDEKAKDGEPMIVDITDGTIYRYDSDTMVCVAKSATLTIKP